MMRTKKEEVKIYQVRLSKSYSPVDMINELTHQVWRVLMAFGGMESSLDPHRWVVLYKFFRESFKKRMVYYPDCGHQETCHGKTHHVFWSRWSYKPPEEGIYLLHVKGEADRFLRGLLAGVKRLFPDAVHVSRDRIKKRDDRILLTLEQILGKTLYFNEGCEKCQKNLKNPERRIWGE